MRYIHLNPIRDGIVKDLKSLDRYAYTGHSIIMGKRKNPDGSHHIFVQSDVPELVNLQNVKGQAKPYQMRQFLKLVEKHDLKLEDE